MNSCLILSTEMQQRLLISANEGDFSPSHIGLIRRKNMKKFLKLLKEEKGAVMTVEATFVFPIMFFVLLFMIYYGNIFFVKSNVDSVVSRYAVLGAAQCADPQLEALMKNGQVSSSLGANRDPYRYLFSGHGNSVASKISSKVKEDIGKNSFFNGMSPTDISCDVKYKNGIIYQSFKIDVSYKIKFPIRFIFSNKSVMFDYSSVAEAPVVDGGEFVLNTNMAIDYYERSKISDAVNSFKKNISKFFSK